MGIDNVLGFNLFNNGGTHRNVDQIISIGVKHFCKQNVGSADAKVGIARTYYPLQ